MIEAITVTGDPAHQLVLLRTGPPETGAIGLTPSQAIELAGVLLGEAHRLSPPLTAIRMPRSDA